MADDIVTQVIDCWSDTTIRTHSVECWKWHPHCAIGILAAEIERLNNECETLRIDLAAAYCRIDDMEGLNDD